MLAMWCRLATRTCRRCDYEAARQTISERVWAEVAEDWTRVAREAQAATSRAIQASSEKLKVGDLKAANTAASASRTSPPRVASPMTRAW